MAYRQKALIQQLQELEEENQLLKDTHAFQELTLSQLRQEKEKYRAIYSKLYQRKHNQLCIAEGSFIANISNLSSSKTSTNSRSIGRFKQQSEKSSVKWSNMEPALNEREPCTLRIEISEVRSQKGELSTLKSTRVSDENRETVESSVVTPRGSNKSGKRSYFQKSLEGNANG